MNRFILAATFAALVPACHAATDPGSGTGTLFTLVEIAGKPDSTKIELELMARGNPVVGANVVFTDAETGEVHVAEGRSAGNYRVNVTGYARTLAVKVTSGDDELEAQLEGPAPHIITRPQNNAIVRRRDFDLLKVQWDADDPADRVTVDPEDAEDILLVGDPFETEIPLGALKNGEQKIEVIRETSVELRGGAAGSRMRSRYEVDNRFTIEG